LSQAAALANARAGWEIFVTGLCECDRCELGQLALRLWQLRQGRYMPLLPGLEPVTICDLIWLLFSSHLPYAFAEHGALMLANVLTRPAESRACGSRRKRRENG